MKIFAETAIFCQKAKRKRLKQVIIAHCINVHTLLSNLMTKILLQDIHGNSLKVVYEFFNEKEKGDRETTLLKKVNYVSFRHRQMRLVNTASDDTVS